MQVFFEISQPLVAINHQVNDFVAIFALPFSAPFKIERLDELEECLIVLLISLGDVNFQGFAVDLEDIPPFSAEKVFILTCGTKVIFEQELHELDFPALPVEHIRELLPDGKLSL
jgi:hypothetical protein